MLDSATASKVLDHGMFVGADFVELFVEKSTLQNISILNSKVHKIDSGIDFGIGVRLIYGQKVLYGYTNKKSLPDLLQLVETLAANDWKESKQKKTELSLVTPNNLHPYQFSVDSDYETKDKISYLMKIDQFAREESEKIIQVSANGFQKKQEIEIFNSEGIHTLDTRNYCRISASVIAKDGNEQTDGGFNPGGLSGWEFHEKVDPKLLGRKSAKQALVKLDASPCPSGKMPVIIDNGFGGVIFHEACGHLLETTSVAKKASVFWDKLDQPIANECVSAVDDGTLTNLWGSINIDDEGMPTKKTQLIKDGKLNSFMVDKVGSMKTGYERTGSGRRQSYKFAPASRMRNTYIEPGENTLEQMISSVEEGIYCKAMGGGSVSPGTGDFNFSARESYLIKNGKIDSPLKAASLIGSGPEVLKQISMIGNNLDFDAGICGSVSGAIPTTVGQGAVKVDEILVGGQK